MNANHVAALAELAGLIQHRIGAWQHFGYENPPDRYAAVIPPLGERDAAAIKAGHAAVDAIDQLMGRLYEVRSQLVGELRDNQDILMAKPLPSRVSDA